MALGGWQAEAKRWAKYPATLLFGVSLLWLVRNLFALDWADAQPETETGLGVLLLLINLVLVPLGGVVVGIYVLYLKRWALALAPLVPLLPLLTHTAKELPSIGAKFAQYRAAPQAAVPSLGGGVMDSFVLLALWAAYALMLWYLYRAYRLLGMRQRWRGGSLAAAGSSALAVPEGEPDVCLLLPEVDDAESA